MASEVASAIAYMHGATGELFGERHEGIFHRDIKPENILLSSDGDGAQARVSDFGTARAVAARMGPEGPSLGTSTMTKTVGTTPYMCPRYFRTGRFGAKSDVFSLGVMLLQLATGMAAHEVHHLEETSWSLDARAGAWPKEVGDALVALGRWCVNETYEERPGMDVVAERLKQMEQAGKTGNVDMLQVEDELMKASGRWLDFSRCVSAVFMRLPEPCCREEGGNQCQIVPWVHKDIRSQCATSTCAPAAVLLI